MCMSSSAPKPMAPPPPPPVAKAPDTAPLQKKRNAAPSGPDTVANKTLLTGAAGVPATSLQLGGTTLLGGNK